MAQFLVTHAHWDHYSQALALRESFGTRVRIGRGERPSIEAFDMNRGLHPRQVEMLRRCGAGALADEIASLPVDRSERDVPHPAGRLAGRRGAHRPHRKGGLDVFATPGHTRGHIVMRDADAGLLFAGDHILPHITPSIGLETEPEPKPLRSYLESLRLVRGMPDTLLLPAHGPVRPSVHTRIDELLEHHAERLDAAAAQVRAGRGTAFAAAEAMPWTRRKRALSDLDAFSRMLAVLEIEAHLDVLADRGVLDAHERTASAATPQALTRRRPPGNRRVTLSFRFPGGRSGDDARPRVHPDHVPRGAARAARRADAKGDRQGARHTARLGPGVAGPLAVLPDLHQRRGRQLRRLPKGDPPGFVHVIDDTTVAIPDRPGNRRADGFMNVLSNPHVGLIFLIPGRGETLRINGRATLLRDAPFFDEMVVEGNRPALALVVDIEQIFFHCAKALMRSKIWKPETWDPEALPSHARIVKDVQYTEENLQQLEEYYPRATTPRSSTAADHALGWTPRGVRGGRFGGAGRSAALAAELPLVIGALVLAAHLRAAPAGRAGVLARRSALAFQGLPEPALHVVLSVGGFS